jgi:ankyrin repeat protein
MQKSPEVLLLNRPLDGGAYDPNYAEGELGITPLMVAVARGSVEMVQLLIQRGADCWKTGAGGSAFDFAGTEEKRTLLQRECAATK